MKRSLMAAVALILLPGAAVAQDYPSRQIIMMVAAMDSPGLREQLNELAATLVTPERRTPAYLAGFVKSKWDKWGAAIRAGGAIPK